MRGTLTTWPNIWKETLTLESRLGFCGLLGPLLEYLSSQGSVSTCKRLHIWLIAPCHTCYSSFWQHWIFRNRRQSDGFRHLLLWTGLWPRHNQRHPTLWKLVYLDSSESVLVLTWTLTWGCWRSISSPYFTTKGYPF